MQLRIQDLRLGKLEHAASQPNRMSASFHPAGQDLGRTHARALGLSTAPRELRWSPPADLAPYIGEYYLNAVDHRGSEPHHDAFEPGQAKLMVVVSGGARWQVRSARGSWLKPAPVSLFGPSSALIWSESPPAVVLGARIRPRGWLRLLDQSAKDWADRIDEPPAPSIFDWGHFHAKACALNDDRSVPELLDSLFRELMGPPTRYEVPADRIEAALLNPAITTVGELAEATGFSVRAIERIANCAFGFGPKLLLRRSRFFRSLKAVSKAPPSERSWSIDPTYTDYSHFIRDSHDFLGSAPQVFLKMDLPLMREALQTR